MNKNLIIIIIVAVVAVLAWYGYSRWSGGYQIPEPTGTTGAAPYQAGAPDTTASIASDLQNTDLGDIDQNFRAIDQDLQSL